MPAVGRRRTVHRCALVAKQQSRTHTVGECETFKDKRDVFEEMRKLDECGMEKFGITR